MQKGLPYLWTNLSKMKRTYHLCWSGGEEVMFRTREDYIHGIICLCIACHDTDTQLMAYCFMSNHVHLCVRSSRIKAFKKAFRYSYTRYFNAKYRRHGSLGENKFFIMEIQGLMHLLTAIAYILRNPVHHGICCTPFEYEYSSVSAAFSKELGHLVWSSDTENKIPFYQIPSHHKIPSYVKVSTSGMILPMSIVDVSDIEHQFSTARTYLYFMNRLSGEEWQKEQDKDNNGVEPIGIEDIERGIKGIAIRQLLANENGKNRSKIMTDIQLCELIDNTLEQHYNGNSIYTIPDDIAAKLSSWLKSEFHIPNEQIARCMGGTKCSFTTTTTTTATTTATQGMPFKNLRH